MIVSCACIYFSIYFSGLYRPVNFDPYVSFSRSYLDTKRHQDKKKHRVGTCTIYNSGRRQFLIPLSSSGCSASAHVLFFFCLSLYDSGKFRLCSLRVRYGICTSLRSNRVLRIFDITDNLIMHFHRLYHWSFPLILLIELEGSFISISSWIQSKLAVLVCPCCLLEQNKC